MIFAPVEEVRVYRNSAVIVDDFFPLGKIQGVTLFFIELEMNAIFYVQCIADE